MTKGFIHICKYTYIHVCIYKGALRPLQAAGCNSIILRGKCTYTFIYICEYNGPHTTTWKCNMMESCCAEQHTTHTHIDTFLRTYICGVYPSVQHWKYKYIYICNLATSEIVEVSRTTSKEQILMFRVQCPFRSFYLGVEREADWLSHGRSLGGVAAPTSHLV